MKKLQQKGYQRIKIRLPSTVEAYIPYMTNYSLRSNEPPTDLAGGFSMPKRREPTEAVKFSGINTTYVAPGCFDLPTIAEEKDGKLEVTSCWKPSAEDPEVLNAGGCVCLCVRGGQPPVALWVQNVEIVE